MPSKLEQVLLERECKLTIDPYSGEVTPTGDPTSNTGVGVGTQCLDKLLRKLSKVKDAK